ncbi:DUF4362 domain-containing protein [Exiguobacterium sp. H66]|uniref:DUF4362 domain-containing protein n=1 Tax=Exiguobacterium sp. H66 TaxID=2751208 RepID=UPI001BE9EDB9|nr:DUF4362 domain-containing protein [Exiguobacterium sp. H66]
MKKSWFCLAGSLLVLSGCGNENYTSEKALKNGDIVRHMTELENGERFQEFIDHVARQETDDIRITSYTTEGDPVFQDVTYDGKQFSYSLDSSQDEFGNQVDDRDGESCQALKKDQTDETHVYLLTDCAEGEDHPLLEATAAELGK